MIFVFEFQNLPTQRTITTVIPKVANPSVQYLTANNGEFSLLLSVFMYAIVCTREMIYRSSYYRNHRYHTDEFE